MPAFAHDDVLDFMVTEAVIVRARQVEEEQGKKAAEKREHEAWKQGAKTTLPDG